eukprot:5807303-Amphidinium_carterae.1
MRTSSGQSFSHSWLAKARGLFILEQVWVEVVPAHLRCGMSRHGCSISLHLSRARQPACPVTNNVAFLVLLEKAKLRRMVCQRALHAHS